MSSIEPGNFVEIIARRGCSLRYVGSTGFVEAIEGSTAFIQLVDDREEPFQPIGEPMPFPIGRLFKLPTPTQTRAKKVRLRRKHLRERRREKPDTDGGRTGTTQKES